MSDLTLQPVCDGGGSVTAADVVAAAVLACPGVAGLHSGGLRQVATYLPGRRVEGVRIDPDRLEVGVVAAFGVPVPALAQRIREALAPLAAGRMIDLYMGDVQLPQDALEPDQPPALPAGSG